MLAFVVLYNLNTVNITERQRELATLKVLGFYDLEVAEYVYRENILLTIIGALVGGGIRQVSACVYYYFCRDRGAHVYPSCGLFELYLCDYYYIQLLDFLSTGWCTTDEKNRHGWIFEIGWITVNFNKKILAFLYLKWYNVIDNLIMGEILQKKEV